MFISLYNLYLENKTGVWLGFLIFLVFLFIALLFIDASSLLAFTPLILVLIIYLIFKHSFPFLFGLIFIRLILDHPSEIFNLTLSSQLVLSASQILGLLIAFVGIIYLFENYNNLKKLPLKLPFIIYFGTSALTIFYSIDRFSTLSELIRLFDLAFLFFFSYKIIKTPRQFNHLLEAVFISSIVPVIVALYQFTSGIGYTDSAFSAPRIFGTLSHPNSFSLYLFSVIVLLILYYFINSKKYQKINYKNKIRRNAINKIFTKTIPFIVAFYLLVLVLTYTRIAWIALAIFFIILSLFKFRTGLVVLVIFTFSLYSFSPTIQERTLDAFSNSQGSSLTWRKTLWKDVFIETINDKKYLSGYGAETFEIVAEDKRGRRLGSPAAHNDFLRAFVEGGIVGLFSFLFLIFYLAFYLFRKYKKANQDQVQLILLFLFAFLISISVASISDNVVRNTPLLWTFLISLGASLGVFESAQQSGVSSLDNKNRKLTKDSPEKIRL